VERLEKRLRLISLRIDELEDRLDQLDERR
jgi:hypothetical protein